MGTKLLTKALDYALCKKPNYFSCWVVHRGWGKPEFEVELYSEDLY